MSDPSIEPRLKQCFLAVFPALKDGEVESASVETVSDWDSAAQVTLITLVEEEFGIETPIEQYAGLTSFGAFVRQLEPHGDARP